MNDLKEGECPTRQWFCLNFEDGLLYRLGDCGDYEAADEIAEDLGLNSVWLINGPTAQLWSNAIATGGITPALEMAHEQ